MRSIAVVITILLSHYGFGQEYNYFSFNELYGFNTSTVYDIQQDTQDNYWLGTAEGLVQFNGRDFSYYAPAKYSKEVTNVKFDAFGRVWCSNYGGQLFYLKNKTMHTAINIKKGGSFISEYHVVSDSIVYYIQLENRSLHRHNIYSGKSRMVFSVGDSASIINLKREQNDLIVTYQKVIDYQTVQRAVSRAKLSVASETITPIDTTYISFPSSKLRVCQDGDQWYFVSGGAQTLLVAQIGDNNVWSLQAQESSANNFSIVNGELLVLSKKGVTAYSLSSGTRKNLVSGLNVSTMFKDAEGNLLLGTLDNGIFQIANTEVRTVLHTDKRISRSLLTPDLSLFYLDTEGDLYYAAPPYTESRKIDGGFTPGEAMVYSPVYNKINFAGAEKYVDLASLSAKATANTYFKDFFDLNQHERIYATGSSTTILNERGNALNVHQFPYNFSGFKKTRNPSSILLRATRANKIVEDIRKKFLYINYIDGVYCYSKKRTPEVLQLNHEPVLASCIVQDPVAGIWLGTLDGHLLHFDGTKLVFQIKLPSEVKHIAISKNVAFLDVGNALHRLNLKTRAFSRIDQTDGIIPGKITSLFLQKNRLYIVGGNRIQYIPVSYQYTNASAPRIFLDEVQLYNEKIRGKKTYQFGYDENHLTFVFHAIATRSQKEFHYEYRLSGTSNKWTTLPGDVDRVTFARLAPGNYTFEVRAINEDGKPSEIKHVSFSIDKHFSQKWWFILLMVLTVAVVVFLIVRIRYRALQKQNQLQSEQERLKKEVYKSKIAAIRSQMNPHFMFNALNTIQEFIMTNQKDVASEYLADFADLMRKYLEQSKEEEITLSEEIETLEIYLSLENLRSDGALDYSVYCEPTINPFDSTIPVMLIQPFVENAIKHGLLHKKGEKRLRILFERIDKHGIRCTIEDNGIGRQASAEIKGSHQHASFATKALDQKMEMVNKSSSRTISCKVLDLMENDAPAGTKVVIEIQ